MNIVFMGSPELALPCLEVLYRSEHKIVGVVTQPDRPAGRGRKLTPCAVAAQAREWDLPLYQPLSLKDPPFAATLQALEVDLAVIVAYGRILSREVLETPRHGCWNLHFSKLPQYRGAAPMQWALINGETETGVSIIRLVKELDAGPILKQQAVAIEADDTVASLGPRLAQLGPELLLQCLTDLDKGTLTETVQDEAQASLAPSLKKEEAELDWTQSGTQLVNRIRGLNPWPVAFSYIDKHRLKIYSARAVAGDTTAQPGTVLQANDADGLVIACGDGALAIDEMQLEGKKRMSSQDFLHGTQISIGMII